jgi:hypothetical protein
MVAINEVTYKHLKEFADRHHDELFNMAGDIQNIEDYLCGGIINYKASLGDDNCRVVGDLRRTLVTLTDGNINEL